LSLKYKIVNSKHNVESLECGNEEIRNKQDSNYKLCATGNGHLHYDGILTMHTILAILTRNTGSSLSYNSYEKERRPDLETDTSQNMFISK
jgi:hypothetical protein